MKLAIMPPYVFSAIVGLALWSLSERLNPGYVDCGDWIIWFGFSLFTLAVTRMHAAGEANRNIPRSRKWLRVVYRGLILVSLSLLVYKSELHTDMWSGIWSILLLSINQAFLFGLFFDIWYNEFRGNSWDYHGTQSWYDIVVSKRPKAYFVTELVLYVVTSVFI